jgi:hypothetical protein
MRPLMIPPSIGTVFPQVRIFDNVSGTPRIVLAGVLGSQRRMAHACSIIFRSAGAYESRPEVEEKRDTEWKGICEAVSDGRR